ncbi:MAG: hypothetical protein A2X35_11570 [Elusimicrobia bacterium GWA2_61_42]|nr:MAG: hypothetical protein A2X35_11570 [Elusimicrobia bacterium GWA2_61_42]OGR75825.1 MAG: hypothetical protein A2X38_07345 [Elusimicrobia bacterium GWC2_61_25]
MNSNNMQLIFAGLFMFAAAVPALAQEKSAEEKQMDKVEADLNTDAAQPEGQAVVAEKLKKDFKVDDARLNGLRDKQLKDGEMAIALALAEGLPGGITDENVQKVVAMRQGPPVAGWGKVAKDLGVKVGPALSKAKKTAAEARKSAKAEKARKEKKEKAEKMKAEKSGKAERPAKAEKGGGKGKH